MLVHRLVGSGHVERPCRLHTEAVGPGPWRVSPRAHGCINASTSMRGIQLECKACGQWLRSLWIVLQHSKSSWNHPGALGFGIWTAHPRFRRLWSQITVGRLDIARPCQRRRAPASIFPGFREHCLANRCCIGPAGHGCRLACAEGSLRGLGNDQGLEAGWPKMHSGVHGLRSCPRDRGGLAQPKMHRCRTSEQKPGRAVLLDLEPRGRTMPP
mmetsp:Transcript_26923/g.63185  ORF Transcript_26923/g.63185 Transcript_26923/m.63185 type:complete len:213 (-) Transcript_26923:314-952(-)